MTIKHRIIERADNALIILVLFLVMGIYSCTQAQGLKQVKFIGFDASFGVRSFQVSSSIAKINGMHAAHEGGSLGLAFGNEVFKAKIRAAGFYYSNANTPYTQELFEVASLVNFYPLALKHRNLKLQPYVTTGITKNNTKFFGTYLPDRPSNDAYEPLLGKVSQINATGGIGLEFQFPSEFDFVHIFAEALYGTPIQSRTNGIEFSATSLKKFTSISFGVSFGKYR